MLKNGRKCCRREHVTHGPGVGVGVFTGEIGDATVAVGVTGDTVGVGVGVGVQPIQAVSNKIKITVTTLRMLPHTLRSAGFIFIGLPQDVKHLEYIPPRMNYASEIPPQRRHNRLSSVVTISISHIDVIQFLIVSLRLIDHFTRVRCSSQASRNQRRRTRSPKRYWIISHPDRCSTHRACQTCRYHLHAK